MKKLDELRTRVLDFKDRAIATSKDYSHRVVRAGTHVAIHFLQGAEFGAKIGGTTGLLVVGLTSFLPGVGVLTTLAAKGVGVITLTAMSSVAGAAIKVATSGKQVLSELKGQPADIPSFRAGNESLKSVIDKLTKKLTKKPEPSDKEVVQPASLPSSVPDFVASSGLEWSLEDTVIHEPLPNVMTEAEKNALVESMLYDYVRFLDVREHQGYTFLYALQKKQMDLLVPELTDRIDALYAENPQMVLDAIETDEGRFALMHAQNAAEVDMLINLSPAFWRNAANAHLAASREAAQVPIITTVVSAEMLTPTP
ncbi:MAG TPA: hypothetical protein PKI93_01365 [Alphaproteobacteria bacterium]|nr:hypothetical protein [Alphaproteobacteria bacterium]HNS45528.1 hypothetical protein [Alphaproteobacteria bacterium]